MLSITIPESEIWDPIKEEFTIVKKQKLVLEHSLVSMSKWEAKYHKPFLSNTAQTRAETIDYIKCMTITQNVPDSAYLGVTDAIIQQVVDYIGDPMTATTFKERPGAPKRRQANTTYVSSELIYYWMFSYNIPISTEKWHLNRLMTLIRIFDEKAQKPTKQSPSERRAAMASQRSLNAQRRAAAHSKG